MSKADINLGKFPLKRMSAPINPTRATCDEDFNEHKVNALIQG